MIKSMTGFGRSEQLLDTQSQQKRVTVEIRTLNSKQLDLSLRLPSSMRAVEADVRGVITKGVQRGKCEVFVNIASEQNQASSSINEALFAQYCRQIRSAYKAADISGDVDSSIAALALKMPDVIVAAQDSTSEQESQAVVKAVAEAVSHLDKFREQEGAILIADLLRRVSLIEEHLTAVEPFEKPRVEAIRERIREHIAKEKITLDSNRLEAEMIFYVEKLDVTEEKVRLRNHCNYFREVAAEEQGVGRKLGFIAQEMGREINTLGSKSNDAGMQRLVVQMKDELEKIKEQVLNIL